MSTQPTTQPSTQPTEIASQIDKASWDSALTKAFVEICVERVKAGDRPNTHFTRDGWQKIVSSFAEKTGKSYDQTQLKNKWDNLRKEWRVWEKLIIGETGLGWDPIRQTVLADNDWWDKKIKQDKRCAKFRTQGIENRDLLEFLFGGQGATGIHAFIPTAQIANEDDDETQPYDGGMGSNEPLMFSLDEDSEDPEYDVNEDVAGELQDSPTPPPRVRRTKSASGSRGRKRRRAMDVREDINHSLGQLVSAVSSRNTNNNEDHSRDSISAVMEKLEEIPETASGGPLLMFALKLFEKKEYREYFNGIERKDWQLAWLKLKHSDNGGNGSDETV